MAISLRRGLWPRLLSLAMFCAGRSSASCAAEEKLAEAARTVLKTYCHRCHGVRFEVKGYDVLDRGSLLAKRGAGESPYVVPGKPEKSELWERVGIERDMPPRESNKQPTDQERELLRRWIAAGAPFPVAAASSRAVKGDRDVLSAIRAHLDKSRREDRPHLRFFSLANLHNNRAVADDELRLARAALSKLLNSLGSKPEIVVPAAVDADGIVLVVDERELGWDTGDRDLWEEILSVYPYGLTHDADPAEADRNLALDVAEKSGVKMPFVRADWFIASASRPPLYHTLLALPNNARDLERSLKVDVEADFRRDALARAGFAKSGVSIHNRIVDRHSTPTGPYWKSYDFRADAGTSNIFRFPLGPVFADHPFGRQAFIHAGGEIIFGLPNGMQGYLLVDGKGDRIDAGPIDIVGDDEKTSGTPSIVNGLSCMACHRLGMQTFKDEIRDKTALGGEPRTKVERLFPTREAMNKLLARDEERFLAAVDRATGPFLKTGADASKSIRDFPEPIGVIARVYLRDLDAAAVAAELALPRTEDLLAFIRANPKLGRLSLGQLIDGGVIKRSDWDSLDRQAVSTFQETAAELKLGTPYRAF